MKRKRAFTLIELIAVLVILAILALIVTPLVMNIIKSVKENADKRSVDNYYHAVELAASEYLLDTGKKSNSFDDLNVKYSGNKVECDVSMVYKNNIFLSKCKVNEKYVKDSKSSDGYYQVGDLVKYGKQYYLELERASLRYIGENGKSASDISQLDINTPNNSFSCENYKVYRNGALFLSKCNIDGYYSDNTEDGYYHYGESKGIYLAAGTIVKYNDIDFYVLTTSEENEDSVTLIKMLPLKYAEMQDYILSTEISDKIETSGEYLRMEYYSSDTCLSAGDSSGCLTDYSNSYVKQVVDVWSNVYLNDKDLIKDFTGYKTRLITHDEVSNQFDIEIIQSCPTCSNEYIINDLDWLNVPNNSYDSYWSISQIDDSNSNVWCVGYNRLTKSRVSATNLVRPVITVKKLTVQEV